MWKNYFLVAIRSLYRNGTYSFINILGLSVGIAASLLILLWVMHETSYDNFHVNKDRLYKVWFNSRFADGIGSQTSVPLPLREGLKAANAGIKNVAVTNWGEGFAFSVEEKKTSLVGLHVSEEFLDMFTFPLLAGDKTTALNDISSIVLTESSAKALFGDEDPIGKTVKVENQYELKVTGVLADLPSHSFFTFDFLIPFSQYLATQPWIDRDNWENNSFQMYMELHPGIAVADVENNVRDILQEKSVDKNSKKEVFFHPIGKWRLYSDFENGKIKGGMIEYVQLFTVIGVFILVIACINFMNLATARAERRAREVGIRKSIGSRRTELIRQFIGESMFIAFIAFAIAIVMVELVLPFFNGIVNKQLTVPYHTTTFWLAASGIVLVTGLLSGSYPAFYLSSFNPVTVLKGTVKVGRGASTPRKILVTLQFGFSILLIVGTIVIYQQIQHVKKRDVGYDRDQLMMIWTNSGIENGYQALKQELIQSGAVESVTKSNSPITDIFSSNIMDWPGKDPNTRISFSTIATEYDYLKTMRMRLIEGRDFSEEFKSDSLAIIINKKGREVMGLTEAVGEKLSMWGNNYTIIGVIEDVLMESPYHPVDPMAIVFNPGWSSTISLRLSSTMDTPEAIAAIESVFKKLNADFPFDYRFADTTFERKFATITMIQHLANIFTGLAIVITCLGLFGLASFTAEQRTKEIGIRKVLGASVIQVVLLLVKDFTMLVMFAFVIAAPVSWWVLTDFLERYPYRTGVPWWALPVTGIVALLITVAVVSTQAANAALANPVKSLRSE